MTSLALVDEASGVVGPPLAPTRSQGAVDPFAPYRLVSRAMALAILAVVLVEFARNVFAPTDRDFISFWGAGRMALAGHPAAAYDRAALHTVQLGAAHFDGGEMPFPYMPAFLLLVSPFALLPFPPAMILWTVVTFAFMMVVLHRLYPASGWIGGAFPPVFVNAAIGQGAFLMGGLFIGGLALLGKRPFAAGLVLGLLVVKPQLGMLLPVAFIAGRQWSAIAGAASSALAVTLAGLLLFGAAATVAWLHQMPLYVSIARDGLVGWNKMSSVYAAARSVGAPFELAIGLHLAVASVAAWAVWSVWRSEAGPARKIAILAAGTMLASPYLYLYDAVLLLPTFFWLAQDRMSPGVLTTLWLLPILSIAGMAGVAGMPNIAFATPLALLLIVLRRREPHAAAGQFSTVLGN